MAGKVSGHQELLVLVGRVEGVHEGGVGDGIVVVLVVILLDLSGFVRELSVSSILATGGDMVSFQDPASARSGG